MKALRVVVIVSSDRSDLYFANELIKRVNVVGVIVENQTNPPVDTPVHIKAIRLLPKPHLLFKKTVNVIIGKIRNKFSVYNKPWNIADFGKQGHRLFPKPSCQVLHTSGINNINAPEYVSWLKETKPDLIAVCGASILKDAILSIPTKGTLNLHGGLSQFYRGLFTTDWAVHNEEPEYVGATVHYVSPGIDDGNIVYQGRPEVEATDNSNSLYVKVVKLGVDMMETAIRDIEEGNGKSTPLIKKGDLYLNKMFTQKVLSNTWKKIRKGVIIEYLKHKQDRDQKVIEALINQFKPIH